MAGDLYWDSVALALHMDDVGLTDVKGNAMTLNGGVTRSATESKFGGFAGYFDGTDDEVFNTTPIPEINVEPFSVQFWCFPETQVQANPAVLTIQDLRIEYKPTGYPDGFVINANGTRTACGAFAEDEWHYIWLTADGAEVTVYINGIVIGTVALTYVYGETVWVGSNDIGSNPDSAFTGYVDDVLVTPGVIRTDYAVPVAAFPDTLPDPEGGVLGSLTFAAEAVGLVAPIGDVLGSLRFAGEADGEIYNTGRASGSIRFTGAGVGVHGRTGIGSGSLRFTCTGVGSHGRFGAASGSMRLTGAAVGKHGVAGIAAAAMGFSGTAVGTTPLVPVGVVSGSLRVTGRAVGLGAPVVEDACA